MRRRRPKRNDSCATCSTTTSSNVASRADASSRTCRRSTRNAKRRTKAVIELGVNIDHVATLRQARRTYEPDRLWAAVEAHLAGADGITVHLPEDRRDIHDDDVRRLR